MCVCCISRSTSTFKLPCRYGRLVKKMREAHTCENGKTLGENDVFGGNGRNSNKISNEMEKVAILARMAYLAKMAEMANKRQIVNKVPNEMAKGPF